MGGELNPGQWQNLRSIARLAYGTTAGSAGGGGRMGIFKDGDGKLRVVKFCTSALGRMFVPTTREMVNASNRLRQELLLLAAAKFGKGSRTYNAISAGLGVKPNCKDLLDRKIVARVAEKLAGGKPEDFWRTTVGGWTTARLHSTSRADFNVQGEEFLDEVSRLAPQSEIGGAVAKFGGKTFALTENGVRKFAAGLLKDFTPSQVKAALGLYTGYGRSVRLKDGVLLSGRDMDLKIEKTKDGKMSLTAFFDCKKNGKIKPKRFQTTLVVDADGTVGRPQSKLVDSKETAKTFGGGRYGRFALRKKLSELLGDGESFRSFYKALKVPDYQELAHELGVPLEVAKRTVPCISRIRKNEGEDSDLIIPFRVPTEGKESVIVELRLKNLSASFSQLEKGGVLLSGAEVLSKIRLEDRRDAIDFMGKFYDITNFVTTRYESVKQYCPEIQKFTKDISKFVSYLTSVATGILPRMIPAALDRAREKRISLFAGDPDALRNWWTCLKLPGNPPVERFGEKPEDFERRLLCALLDGVFQRAWKDYEDVVNTVAPEMDSNRRETVFDTVLVQPTSTQCTYEGHLETLKKTLSGDVDNLDLRETIDLGGIKFPSVGGHVDDDGVDDFAPEKLAIRDRDFVNFWLVGDDGSAVSLDRDEEKFTNSLKEAGLTARQVALIGSFYAQTFCAGFDAGCGFGSVKHTNACDVFIDRKDVDQGLMRLTGYIDCTDPAHPRSKDHVTHRLKMQIVINSAGEVTEIREMKLMKKATAEADVRANFQRVKQRRNRQWGSKE